MRIYTRILLVVAVLLLVFAGAFVLVKREERRNTAAVLGNREEDLQTLTEGVIELSGRNLASLAEDYGRWDEMVDFARSHDRSWASDNLATGLATFDAQAEWVYGRNGELLYACTARGHEGLASPPINAAAACSLLDEKRLIHFHQRYGDSALEIRGSTVVPSRDEQRETPAQGYFFAVRVWDSARTDNLGQMLGDRGRFAIESDNEDEGECPSVWTEPDGAVVVCHDLPGFDGRRVAQLRARIPSPRLGALLADVHRNLVIAGGLALALLLGVFYALVHWVASPLRVLSTGLAARDPTRVAGLARSATEIGALARLVELSMEQREELETGIEQLREAQDAIRESEERYRTLFDTSSDGVLVVSDVIEDVNSRLCEMSGWTREQLIGSPPGAFGMPVQPGSGEEQAEERERLGAALRGEPRLFRWTIRRADDEPMAVEVAVVGVTMRGQRMWLASVRDITERLRAEEERLRLEAEVQRAQRLESLTALAGGVAHDFNNILQAVIGNVDIVLHDTREDDPSRPRIETVRTAALRAAGLAQQMLAYSGHGRFESLEIDISGLVRESAPLVESAVPKLVWVSYDLDGQLPPVRGDRMQLQQTVVGLITNAAESYGGAEGIVSVRTWCERDADAKVADMRVEGTVPEGDAVVLEVSDHGCGIGAGRLERLFEPFSTRRSTGRGLGLASVLGIARRHDGAVAVRSTEGEGSVFRLVLPAASSPKAAAEAAGRPEQPGTETRAGTGRLVLIADDEPDIREMASVVLEAAGFEVATAADGLEAVSVFRARQAEFGLVVLDMNMPRMGGDDALREIRALRPDIPAVIASGYSEEDATASVTGLGLMGFLQKPFRPKELTAMARHAIGDSDGQQPAGQVSSN